MKNFVVYLALVYAALVTGNAAEAAVIGTYTHNYGDNDGYVAPNEYGKIKGKHVEVESDSSGNSDFRDVIDFSRIGLNTSIYSIELTLDFDNAGPDPKDTENWFAEISGAGSGIGSNTYALLDDDLAPQTITLLPGMDAFNAAVASLSIDFTFLDPDTGETDDFKLYSARVRINGTVIAAVPLPASGLMLILALGGLAFIRRKSG